jgi:hypothetical protein
LTKSTLKGSNQKERRRLQQRDRRLAKRRMKREEIAEKRCEDTLYKIDQLMLEAYEAVSRAEALSVANSNTPPLGAWRAQQCSDDARQKARQGRLAADEARLILCTVLARGMKKESRPWSTVLLGEAIIRSRDSRGKSLSGLDLGLVRYMDLCLLHEICAKCIRNGS